MEIKELKKQFVEKYGDGEVSVFFAPGRVNLIGEHVDYNGGYVFPCALDFGTTLVIRKRNDSLCKFTSLNMPLYKEVDLSKPFEKVEREWINYPVGVIKEFEKLGHKVSGLEFLYFGTIPDGAGLSSSASIEVVTAYAINDLFKCGIDTVKLSVMSQSAEHWVGVNCGIMDQFIIANGKKNHAVALDCNTLKFEAVPCEIGDYKIVIGNTNKKRELAASKYNERRGECDLAVSQISQKKKINTLCELDNKGFDEVEDLITSDIVRKRAKHAISENCRVFDAIKALKNNDLKAFGQLINQSHDSLRDDYEVTGIELDTMVEESRKIDGVLGSRMTGAGFGGCTVSLVHKDSVNKFIEQVGKNYEAKIGLKADFYIGNVGDGVKKVE